MKVSRMVAKSPRILVTGCLGQIGQELVPALRAKYGADAVIGSDVRIPFGNLQNDDISCIDLSIPSMLMDVVIRKRVDWIVHNASILSAAGEKNPDLAMKVNVDFVNTVLQVARSLSTPQKALRVFIPSSISAFGPTTPRHNTPNVTIQQPTTIYGVSKVYAEMMGSYYKRFGVDFRSLRYPGIVSAGEPGGGTTDWIVHIFKEALLKGYYHNCFLSADTALPMMYMPDCLKATIDFVSMDDNPAWTSRVYNVTAMSVSPRMMEAELRKYIPKFNITYTTGDMRQSIADSWPVSIDDSAARKDWGWKPQYGLEEMTKAMLIEMRDALHSQGHTTVPFKI